MEKVQVELNFGEGENWKIDCVLCSVTRVRPPSPAERKRGEGLALERAINIRGNRRT